MLRNMIASLCIASTLCFSSFVNAEVAPLDESEKAALAKHVKNDKGLKLLEERIAWVEFVSSTRITWDWRTKEYQEKNVMDKYPVGWEIYQREDGFCEIHKYNLRAIESTYTSVKKPLVEKTIESRDCPD